MPEVGKYEVFQLVDQLGLGVDRVAARFRKSEIAVAIVEAPPDCPSTGVFNEGYHR